MEPGPILPWQLPGLADHLDDMLNRHDGVEGKAAVDIGCGEGWLVRRLIAQGAQACGVECGPEMLRRAHANDPDGSHRYHDAGAQDLPFDADGFDVAVFSFSLHHVPAPDMADALSEAARVVRSGGYVHVVEPVAAGLGHEVDALVDDETHVRALAQAAVDAAVSDDFVPVDTLALTMGTPYEDFGDYEDQLVGIDPARATAFATHQAQVEALFHTNAVQHQGRWWFEDHLLIRSFSIS